MVITNFEEARKYLSLVPNIDFGGCGIAAISLYRWVKQNEGESPGIILLYSPFKGEVGSCRKGPSHCGIEYKEKILDRSEVIPLDLYSNWMKISEGGMINLLNALDNWNETFDRKHVPVIGKHLGIDLSDVCIKAE
jgi:hypothetical protein